MGLAAALAAGCRRELPEVSLRTGMDQVRQGDYRAAARRLDRAARLLPGNATAQANLGVACWKMGQNSRAATAFRRAADLNRKDPRSLEFLGQVFLQMKRWDDARAAFDEAAQRCSPDARLLTEMALAQFKSGKGDRGHALLKEAVQLDPGYPPALYNLAVYARDVQPNPGEAATLFQRYLKVADDDPHARAARQFLRIPEPASPDAEPAAAGAGAEDRAAAATPDAGKASKTDVKPRTPAAAKPPDPLLAAARSAVARKTYDEALVLLNQAMKKDPSNPDAVWELAELYDHQLGFKDSAAQMYRKFDWAWKAPDKLPSSRANLSLIS